MYNESILGVIDTIIKNDRISEEVMQDVFLKVWDNSENYSTAKGRFFTWILNIARNAAIDKVRSKQYRISRENVNGEIIDHLNLDAQKMENQTNNIGISNLVDSLPKKERRIIKLIYFRGYTQKEASESLGIPLGTIKSRSRSSLHKLRTMVVA